MILKEKLLTHSTKIFNPILSGTFDSPKNLSEEEPSSPEYAQRRKSPDLTQFFPGKSIALASEPKLYIPLTFCPHDCKPYSLDCLLDSGAQLNLAHRGEINRGWSYHNRFHVFTSSPSY